MTVKFDMTNEEYHLDPALSASGTKTIAMHDLATFKYAERKESTAFDVGTATHTFVLQPELSGEVWCGPETRRGLEWKQKKHDAEEAGALLLTESDYKLPWIWRRLCVQTRRRLSCSAETLSARPAYSQGTRTLGSTSAAAQTDGAGTLARWWISRRPLPATRMASQSSVLTLVITYKISTIA